MMMNERLQELLNRYLSGPLTETDYHELVSLLGEEAAVRQLEALVGRQLTDGMLSIAGDLPATERRIVEGVLQKIQAPPAPVRRIRSFRRWGWAAAAVLLMAGAGIVWLRLQNRHTPASIAGGHGQTDVAPGGYKAMLTLSDGTNITLDSAADGVLARQGNTSIVKPANGRISYTSQGAAAGGRMTNTLRTPRGGQYQLTLPDGTQVWLNAASSITYPTGFAGGERRVTVSGEAYFEVAKNKEKPFIVDIGGKSTVEVLGTRFNVNSYANEAAVTTTLLQGSVRVGLSSPSRLPTPDSRLLSPGQQAQVSGRQLSVVDHADIDKVMAWKNGLFNFDNAGLGEVMRQLERWYDVEVVYEKGVPDIRFEGEISRNIGLSDLLKVLARADVKFRLEEGRRLVVLP